LNPLPVGSPSPNPTPNPTPTPPIEPPTCYSGGGQNCLNGGTNDYPSVSTYYYYTPLGDLKKVLQGEQERTFTYDSMKRLKSATNPESGTITYNYDASSNLIEKTDARGVKTHYGYDKLNRIVSRSYTDETGYQTPQVNYYYDGVNSNQSVPFGKGKLTKVTSSISTTEYTSFDGLGRVLAHKQTTDGNDYTTSYVYNLSGALIEETYPSNRVVKNTLDTDGDLSQVQSKRANETFKNYANGFTYTNWGAVSAMRLGNGRWENTQFNSRLQPVQIGLGASATNQSLLKLNYDYGTTDNNGNIKSQQIGFQGLAQLFIQTYQYDSLNRLKSATETQNNAQTWKQSFTFDRYGNRRFDTTNNNTTTLTPNCPTNICNPEINQQNNRLIGYQFDSSGNTTQDAESRQFIYDGENKQVEVKDQYGTSIGKYFYDGDGRRVKKISALEITIFVYNGGGKLVAEYSTELSQTPQVSYLTNDHLGSPRINTNQLGQVTARHDYLPFGEEIYRQGQGTDKVRQKFTSYERDNETELDFGQARYYSSKLGRFYSVDPENYQAFSDISNPQSWNAYAYVNNNPCKYADPTGTCICLGQRFSNWWNGYGFSSDKQVEEEYQKRVAFLKGLQEYNSTINGVPVNTDNMTRKQIWDNAESIADYMRKHPQEFQRVEVEVNEDGTPQSTPEITINPPDFPGRGSTKSRPSFPPNVNRGLLNKVLRGEAPRESLSAAEREIAAKFYEQTAKTTGGTMPNATRLFNEARANYLRNGGTPPGKIGDWMKRNNIPKN
jgi:RHS repeat-associated protein